MRIAIVVFDGFDDLDAFGPHEVLSMAGHWVPDWHVDLVAVAAGTIVSGHGLSITVSGTLQPGYDGVVVAGGAWDDAAVPGVAAEIARAHLVDAVARAAEPARWVASVCTGAFVLYAAGLLAGRPCTTHSMAADDLRAVGADVVVGPRVVDAGPVVSSAGITSGLDLGLHLVRRELGAEVGDTIARILEYPAQTEPTGSTRSGTDGRPVA